MALPSHHRYELRWKLSAVAVALVLVFALPAQKPAASAQERMSAKDYEQDKHMEATDRAISNLAQDVETKRAAGIARREADRDADRARISALETAWSEIKGGLELLVFLVGGGFIASLRPRKA